jgi:hypothetical protein
LTTAAGFQPTALKQADREPMGVLCGVCLLASTGQKTMNIAKKFEQPKAGIKVSSCEEIIFRFSENN